MDVLLRAQRTLASAEAFFIRATARRQTVPTEVVTDKHQAYLGAVRKHARYASCQVCKFGRAVPHLTAS
jgi:transposase-like protein